MNYIQKNREIILASASPRRKQLLSQIGLDFKIQASNFDESKIYYEDPAEYVMNLAKYKAQSIAANVKSKNCLVIGADTTVYFNNKYLNKAIDEQEAKEMLLSLSNNWHSVFSGICVIDTKNNIEKLDYSETKVKFRKLTIEEIEYYISTGSPMDKAGSYGIQDDFGAIFVEEIIGDYYNVVGLPLVKLYKMLRELD